MGQVELLLIAIGLAMDAFATSITRGLAVKNAGAREAACAGLWFGSFQALMPLAGYFLGSRFTDKIEAFDHWAAFVILTIIGVNMIREAFGKSEDKEEGMSAGVMFPLAVATSIDALAVGVTFALLKANVYSASAMIGAVTFVVSFAGVFIGRAFGARYKKGAAILGGAILIFLGTRILLTHLGII